MRDQRKLIVMLVAAAVVGGATAAILGDRRGGKDGAPPALAKQAKGHVRSYAELVAANYRVLSAEQSRALLRFAKRFRRCLGARGIDLGVPRPQPTRIELPVEGGVTLHMVAREGIVCGDRLGGPPRGATIQSRGRTVLLYLPKQCLVDKQVLAGRAAPERALPNASVGSGT